MKENNALWVNMKENGALWVNTKENGALWGSTKENERGRLQQQQLGLLPVFCCLNAAHSAGSMSHDRPAADAISLTI